MDELQLLREMRQDTTDASDSMLDGGRHQLLRRINVGETVQTKKRGKKALRITLTSVATLGLVTALVAGNVVGLAGWRGGASAEAAEVLNKAAEMAIKTSDPVVGPGQYLKIDSTNLWASSASRATGAVQPDSGTQWFWLDTEKIATYIPANRQEEWVMVRSDRIPTTFFDDETRAFAMDLPRDRAGTSGTVRGRNGSFYEGPDWMPSESDLASMPRDPYLLLNSIYKQSIGQGKSPDSQAMVVIADLLRTGLIPADLRAALYKAAAMIPGMSVVDNQATLDGQVGVAIGRVENDSARKDIIIDPKTGLMIGERTVGLKAFGSIPAGTAFEWTTIRTSVVDTAP